MQGTPQRRLICLTIAAGLLTGCVSDTAQAPVSNAWYSNNAANNRYLVHRGDTLYSIAWTFGLDYRALAHINNISPPYALNVGQRIRMTNIAHGKWQHPSSTRAKSNSQPATRRPTVTDNSKPTWQQRQPPKRWQWPLNGPISQGFSATLAGNPGINISGQLNSPVRAAAAGEVVYSGTGVRGYGNLIIVKHNSSYLSAYAFTRQPQVRLGGQVKRGQIIASVGRNNDGQAELHFEIRRNGKPINPTTLLPKRRS